MKRIIHFIFLLIFILISSHHLNAQTDRANLDIKNQKIEVTPTFETQPAENIPEKQTTIKFQQSNKKTDSLLPANQPIPNMVSNKISTKEVSTERKSLSTINKNIDSDDVIKTQKIDESIFPDFKVEATQEQPYDNGFVLQEKTSQKLVKLERVPTDNVQVTNVNTTTQNRVTISPSKRKYLEGMVIELEKEIQSNPDNTSIVMQAKKKELEDLKKLLIE